MIMPNDDFDKDNPQRKSQDTYIVPEKEIRALIGGLRINKSYAVTLRLGAAALVVIESMQNRIKSKSNEANILLLRQLAQEYKNKQFQELINAVIAAIEPEKDDFNSAFMTLARALEFVYGSLPVYSAARKFYEERIDNISKAKNQ